MEFEFGGGSSGLSGVFSTRGSGFHFEGGNSVSYETNQYSGPSPSPSPSPSSSTSRGRRKIPDRALSPSSGTYRQATSYVWNEKATIENQESDFEASLDIDSNFVLDQAFENSIDWDAEQAALKRNFLSSSHLVFLFPTSPPLSLGKLHGRFEIIYSSPRSL